jgi:hypothetical protein
VTNTKQLNLAGSMFDRSKRREAEIGDALKQEEARHEAVVRNMHRLRTLRLARKEKSSSNKIS